MAEQSGRSRATRIMVLGTGGTIAGRASQGADNVGYVAGQVGVSELLAGIAAPDGFSLDAEQVAQVDSKDMDFAIWRRLALRCAHWLADAEVCGIVVTHGTDTLEETAYFLQQVLPAHGKPVVLTCAMRPATSLSPDGPQNVRDALAVASTTGAHGVSVVCAGTVHLAADVQKVHTYRPDAFSSGDAGPLGYVEEGELRRFRDWGPSPDGDALACIEATEVAPRVEVVLSHAGASGGLIGLLLQERATPGVANPMAGLVIAATGNGTLHHEVEAAALRAQAEGVAVMRATRCTQGRILPKSSDALPAAGSLSPVKARVALMLDLLGRRAGG
ncbi:asparaginase [Variovorax dokdonensis]|uniref:Asparaginase n=1 Tax=Variovorax dokdonensis TaxID=344883 RepID=A0ABT7NCD3_9BURK|nr:asparaginase [Variovorax dokdonensis]MDM0045616.1 asparaginase [Variovorax dokdonensis]